jgi:hypothetical protein
MNKVLTKEYALMMSKNTGTYLTTTCHLQKITLML